MYKVTLDIYFHLQVCEDTLVCVTPTAKCNRFMILSRCYFSVDFVIQVLASGVLTMQSLFMIIAVFKLFSVMMPLFEKVI